MIVIQVPYAEKDEAKALGARWNSARKTWYIPDGQAATPFEKWLPPHQPGASQASTSPAEPSGRIDSYVGKAVTGRYFFALEHDCSPFSECAACRPILAASGWISANEASKSMLKALAAA